MRNNSTVEIFKTETEKNLGIKVAKIDRSVLEQNMKSEAVARDKQLKTIAMNIFAKAEKRAKKVDAAAAKFKTAVNPIEEIKSKVFPVMFKEYGPTTNRSRIAFGLLNVVLEKNNKIHLSKETWTYLKDKERRFGLVDSYIRYCKR